MDGYVWNEWKHLHRALPVKIHYVFVDTLKSQIKPWKYLSIVLSKLFIQILKFWFGLQFTLKILGTLKNTKHFWTRTIKRWSAGDTKLLHVDIENNINTDLQNMR